MPEWVKWLLVIAAAGAVSIGGKAIGLDWGDRRLIVAIIAAGIILFTLISERRKK